MTFDFLSVYLLSSLGICFSVYLCYEHHLLEKNRGEKSFCDINDKISCTKVNSSKYATIFGIPMAYLGLFFFLSMFVLTFLSLQFSFPLLYLRLWGLFGAISSFYLLYLEIFKIKSICPLCTITYIFDWLIVILLFI